MKWVIGTGNPDKFREISEMLLGFDLVPLSAYTRERAEERGDTLLANAVAKARFAWEVSGEPSVAEDTGLFVWALGGIPGVLSARFAGPGASYRDNYEKLLGLMEGFPPNERRAEFRTVVAWTLDGRNFGWCEGRLEGFITQEPRGQRGFGYDPVFLYPPMGRTLAEMSPGVKNKISHRARAFRLFRAMVGSP